MKSEREEIEEDTKMIQDIAPHIYHNEYKPVQPEEDSFLLYFEEFCIFSPNQYCLGQKFLLPEHCFLL